MIKSKPVAKNLVVAVDKNNRKIKLVDKLEAHLNDGILHRAIMVFIFNSQGDLLIQKRSAEKMLWPNFWDSTCATHPFDRESFEECSQRRLQEELGFTCPLKYLDKFFYQARYKNIGSEREVCAVLIGFYSGKIKPNKKEVSQTKWIGFSELLKRIKDKPEQFAPWLKISLEKFLPEIQKERLKIIFNNLAKLVEPKIKKTLAQDVSRETAKLLEYPISTGGKRLRPGMAILSCLSLGGKLNDVLSPAAGLEILHNYTLIVDDTIDHGLIRRGQPTIQKKYGPSISECLTIDYTASIFQSIAQHSKFSIISELFARALKIIFEGEILDILFEQNTRINEPYIKAHQFKNITKAQYLKMIRQKTASLFQISCQIGGICANAPKNQLKYLEDYGLNLGLAFQIRDDILDIFGNLKKFGKKVGKDIEEGKGGNIVILLANQELSKVNQKILADILKKKDTNNQDIKKAIQIIKTTSAQDNAQKLAQKYANRAQKSLKKLPQNKWTEILFNLTNFIVEREK